MPREAVWQGWGIVAASGSRYFALMAAGGDGADVLVIEDDEDIRDATVMLLRCEGYAVLGAENGREALGLLRSGAVRPKLIILDLRMPVMDGFAFRAAQLSDPALAAIPVVVFSADGPRVLKAAEALGAVAAVDKPVDGEKLLGVVNEVCAAYPRAARNFTSSTRARP